MIRSRGLPKRLRLYVEIDGLRLGYRLALLISVMMSFVLEENCFAQVQAKPSVLEQFVKEQHASAGLPALWVALIPASGEPLVAAQGVRKFGDETPVTIDDQIHLGSCTKAMTALLCGKLVDQNRLKWTSSIESVLPELTAKIHPDYKDVTLEQLLSHDSGMPANAKNWWHRSGVADIEKVRFDIAVTSLKDPPSQTDAKFLYSNLGYMVAGMMVEKVCSKRWEEAMREEIFQPLEMKSAGFGPPGTKRKIDQPWGHRFEKNWKPDQFDNAPALGPAGTVHASIEDWAKFLQIFLNPNRNQFLKPGTYKELLRVRSGEYALGWIVTRRSWGRGHVLTHAGSNTCWYCMVWVAPDLEQAYVVATNGSCDDVADRLDKVVSQLIRLGQKSK
jgi:CubicO group peptidase (beta-lactamase class C family)